jgi:uncharacterized protein YgiM (DUF1202 family)
MTGLFLYYVYAKVLKNANTGKQMNIVEDFTNLDKVTYELKFKYWEISDNYRVSECPGEFDKGIYNFIETEEGKKLGNELSALTDKVNLIIDEITGKLKEKVILKKKDKNTIKKLIFSFTLNFIEIHAKKVWFNAHDMDLNERAKLIGYYEKFNDKVKFLSKALREQKAVLNIITIGEAIEDVIKDSEENDPFFIKWFKGELSDGNA